MEPPSGAAPAGTARGSVLTLINAAVGAGVLSYPYACRQLGWLGFLVAVVLVALTEAFTLYALAKLSEHSKQQTYAALVHRMLGPRWGIVMSLTVLAYSFGSCIAYLVITGDSFQPLLLDLFGPAWFTSRSAIIAGVGCCCILPFCFRTRLGALQAVSSVCLAGLVAVAGIVVLRSAQILAAPGYSWSDVRAFNTEADLVQGLGALVIIIFGFHSHTNVITVFDELEREPVLLFRGSLSSSAASNGEPLGEAAAAAADAAETGGSRGVQQRRRRPKTPKLAGMVRVVLAALAITGLLYTTVGLAGYLAFPTSARSDIILSFDRPGDGLMVVARAAIGLIMVAAYILNHHPARGGIRDLLRTATGRSFDGPAFVPAETLAYFFSTLAIALRCDDLGSILKLVGGACGTILVFLMPGALLIAYARGKARLSRTRQQQHAAAAAAARQLSEPLLAGGDSSGAAEAAAAWGGEPYSLWRSKLFWSGGVLLSISAVLLTFTAATAFRPATS